MPRSHRSLRFARLLLASAPALAALQACGRSEPGDYLFDGDDVTSGSGGKGSLGGSGLGGTRPGKGGTPSAAGAAIGGSSTGTGGAAATGGVGGKVIGGAAGVGGAVTGGVAGEAGSGAAGEPNQPVTCGNEVCDGSRESCCVSVGGFACISKQRACNGAVLDCTSASDCPGADVCCLSFTSPSGSASTCKDRCVGMNQDLERQLCSTDAECLGNRRCTATVFGVSVCTRRQ